MNYILKMFDSEKEKFFDELGLDFVMGQFFRDNNTALDDFPAVGFRSFLLEPLNKKSSIVEKIDYFLRLPNSDDSKGIITFDSCLSAVKSYMRRPSDSLSSRLLGPNYDVLVGFSKNDFVKPKTVDLKKFGDDFFYYLNDDNLDLIKKRYLK